MLKRLIIAAFAVAFASQALAQPAQLGPGQVWANPTAAQRQAMASSLTSVLDRAFGSTRGAILERGASSWNIVGPSATAGLPWVSAGTGADPLYQILGVSGGGTGASTASSARSNLGLGTMATQNASAVAITGGTITGMPSPSAASDVANKSYVDSTATGLNILAPSKYASAAVLPNTPTYSNGASGVGATLTAGANSTLTVDGTVAALNDVIVVKNQASTFQNGVYTLTQVGSGAAPWILTRATYFDQAAEMRSGSYTFITSGSTNANSSFVLQTAPTTVGTDPIVFNLFSAVGGQIIGPVSTTVGDVATWGNTTGTQLLDTPAVLHKTNPTNFYVASGGNDSNDCLSAPNACLTIQHAVALAMAVDSVGTNITVNIGAGTFSGAVVSGPLLGSGRRVIGGVPVAAVLLKGSGSGSTIIDPSGTCAVANAISINGGATVGVAALTARTTCLNGSDLAVGNYAYAFLNDADVKFGAANRANIQVYNYGTFDANGSGTSYPINITGGAQSAFLLSTFATAVTGISVTNTLTGTPAYSTCFVNAIANSLFVWGGSSTWSGSATGARYCLASNSSVDSEQIVTPLPGNSAGSLQGNASYYTNEGQVCIGGAVGCRDTTAPIGWGAGATFSINPGSSDYSGSMVAIVGTAASTSQTTQLTLGSRMLGQNGGGGNCIATQNNSFTSWPANSMIQSFYDPFGVIFITTTFGIAPPSGSHFFINYMCN